MTVTGESGRPIRVFLLDEHEVVRRGLRELLEDEPDIQVVGEAESAASGLRRIPALRVDVAVLDAGWAKGAESTCALRSAAATTSARSSSRRTTTTRCSPQRGAAKQTAAVLVDEACH